MSAGNPFGTQPAGHHKGADPFGASAPQASSAANGEAPAGLEAPVEQPIDINDPLLTSESLTVAEGDAFATPPPPPDQKWRVKLKHEGVKVANSTELLPWEPAKQKDRNGNVIGLFARTVMSVTIQDPNGKFDGYHLQVPFFYMDTKGNREGISKVMTVLNLLRKPDGSPWIVKGEKLNHKALIERFIQALQTEPELGAESTWEVVCDVCAAEAKKTGGFAKSVQGMTKFQPSKTVRGQYDPDFACMLNRGHGYARARSLATRFFALSELPKTV